MQAKSDRNNGPFHWLEKRLWRSGVQDPTIREILCWQISVIALSLLFGNLRGEEIVLLLFFLMAPLVSTLPIYFLFLLAKVLQAFIFYMLALIYLKGAMEPAH